MNVEGVAADVDVGDRLLDLRHVAGDALAARAAALMMRVRFERGGVRAVRRGRAVAVEAQTLAPASIRVGVVRCRATSWQLKQVTPRVYIALCTKSLPCIRFLCAVPSAKWVNVGLAQLVLFQLPEVLAARRPDRSPPANRSTCPRSDSAAAVPASGTGCRCRWRATESSLRRVHDVGARRAGRRARCPGRGSSRSRRSTR